jgi:1,4-alpha-glucan branching enzyme
MNASPASVGTRTGLYRAVRLSVAAPEAKEVIVTGDFTGWTRSGVKLSQPALGEFEITLHLAPGEYQYRLLIDGVWSDHPAARRRVPNPCGISNCVLQVT